MLLNLFDILKYFRTEKSFVKVKTKIMQKKVSLSTAGRSHPSLYRQIEDETEKPFFVPSFSLAPPIPTKNRGRFFGQIFYMIRKVFLYTQH